MSRDIFDCIQYNTIICFDPQLSRRIMKTFLHNNSGCINVPSTKDMNVLQVYRYFRPVLSTIFLRLNFGLVCLVLFGLQMFCCKCCGRSRDLVVVGFTTTYAISAYLVITTNIVSSNPADGEVYSTQYYAIKFVSDLRQVGGFLQFPPPIN